MTPQLDLYSNIGEIRDALDTLLKRGKPVSVADLQALVATVEAKSRPSITLPAAEVAQLLVPQLLPLLPTPATLAQAGQQAATRIEAAITAGTQASTQQVAASVQESTRQLTAAAAALTKAAEGVPRSVPVDFMRGWGYVAGLALGPLTLVLLLLWLGGAFAGVSQAKYDHLQQEKQALTQAHQRLLTQGRFYYEQVQQYRKKFPKSAPYFPKYVAPATPAPAAE
jgi:hypothetical protein